MAMTLSSSISENARLRAIRPRHCDLRAAPFPGAITNAKPAHVRTVDSNRDSPDNRRVTSIVDLLASIIPPQMQKQAPLASGTGRRGSGLGLTELQNSPLGNRAESWRTWFC